MTLAAAYKSLLFGLPVLFIVFALVRWFQPRERRLPLLRRGLATDLGYAAIAPLIDKTLNIILLLVVIVPFGIIAYGGLDEATIKGGFGPAAALPLWLQAVLMLILGDFLGYWMHRAFHGRRLWNFHAVHHSSVDLDWLSSLRGHPINELANKIATTAPLLVLGFAPVAVAAVVPFLTLFAILLHADVDWDWGPLRSIIASPRFHRWHHTFELEARDKNFAGLLPVWDILFGTYYMPRDRKPQYFGTDTPVPPGLAAQMLFPFRHKS